MLEEKQGERALYRVSECIGYIKNFPPLPHRIFPGFLPYFLKPVELRR
jgi:hypothetical protein